eukprot:726512-Hanusia_phi.AAC.2
MSGIQEEGEEEGEEKVVVVEVEVEEGFAQAWAARQEGGGGLKLEIVSHPVMNSPKFVLEVPTETDVLDLKSGREQIKRYWRAGAEGWTRTANEMYPKTRSHPLLNILHRHNTILKNLKNQSVFVPLSSSPCITSMRAVRAIASGVS